MEEIKENVTQADGDPKMNFSDCFEKWKEH